MSISKLIFQCPKAAFLIVLLLLNRQAATATAFVVGSPATKSHRSFALSLVTVDLPPALPEPIHSDSFTSAATGTSDSAISRGIHQYLDRATSTTDSSFMLSLQERRPPTPEEIAAKKRNFNLWFWGGGFVAPFLATFYYFGLKFWEK